MVQFHSAFIDIEIGHLQDLIKAEEFRTLSPAELKVKQVSATYCYLYTKLKELDLLIDDEDTLFPDETLH